MKHVQKEENYKKLLEGKLGHNLIQTYNAKSMHLMSEWNDYFYNEFKKQLKYDNLESEEKNLGEFSLQCGRRVDALKLWISWKAEGNTGWKKQIEHYLELAQYLEDEVNKDSMLELMSSRTFTNVCLRYRPQNLDVTELNNLNEAIRQKMIFDGNFMTSLTQIKGQTILRPVICNSAVDKKSIDDFLSEIHRIAKDV